MDSEDKSKMLILLESAFCFFEKYIDFLLEIYIFTNPKIKKVKITSNHMNKTKNFEIEKEKLFSLASHAEETVDVLTYMRQNSLAGGHTLSKRREDAYQRILCITHERFGSPDVLAKINAVHLINFVGECPHLLDRFSKLDSTHLSEFLKQPESDEFGREIGYLLSQIESAKTLSRNKKTKTQIFSSIC